MALIFFPLGPAQRRDIVNMVDARHQSLRRWFGGPNPSGETYPFGNRFLQYRHANAVSAWCGRRDSNPHNFRHWNLNPARLPVPPRPLIATYPAAMPEHDAEKCEAVFGRPSCSKLLESITVMIGEAPPNHYRDRCGGLITWADPSAAKKWPFQPLWTYFTPAGHIQWKMVRIDHGRSHFPARPTRACDRTGRCRPQSGPASDCCRSGAPVADAASPSQCHRLASGRSEYTDMVASRPSARYQPQARR